MSNQLFVTAAEAGNMLGGISTALVYKLVKEDRLKHLKIGRRIVIPVTAIHAILDNQVKSL